MADRTLVDYEEDRNEFGPYWRMKIERSSSGEPTVLLTITTDWYDGDPKGHNGMTIVVTDAANVFKPMMDWLER